MAKTGDMPAILNRVHPRYHTPHYAVLVTGAGMILAILFADRALVVAVSTVAMLVYYAIINLTTLKIPREFQVYPIVVPVVGAISCCCLVIFLTPAAWIIGIVGMVSGVIWYGIRRKGNWGNQEPR